MEHGRFEYSPIVSRPPVRWPGDARVAVWVVVNTEHFLFDRPGTPLVPITAGFTPDVLNHGWRDYGVRVGIWRLMDVLERHGIRATVALNSAVCEHYPPIIAAGRELGWEWMGHGRDNTTMHTGLPEEEERGLVASVLETIAEATGARPRGWLSPALTETLSTLDILAEAGLDYVCDWANDDLPYPLRVRDASRTLYSMPYSVEINDIPAFLCQKATAPEFAEMILDQFEVLHEEGATRPRAMCVSLHPFLVGQPFRSRHLDRALGEIAGRDGVWLATGAEILDAYRESAAAAGPA